MNNIIREAMSGVYDSASLFLIVFSLINVVFIARDLFIEYSHKKKLTSNSMVLIFLIAQALILFWAKSNSNILFDMKLPVLFLITLSANVFICTKNIVFSKLSQLFIFLDLFFVLLIGTFLATPIVYEQILFKGTVCFGISCPVKEVLNLNIQLEGLQNKYDSLKDMYSDGELLVTDRKGKEWKKYISNSNIPFTLLYPRNWKLETSVFIDEKGNKVAEFIPGIEEKKEGEPCFDKYAQSHNSNYYLGTIKQAPITIGRYTGELQITKVGYEGGSPNWDGIWYPNTYCLQRDNKAFYMTFYEYSEKPTQQKLYEQILTTLKFLN